ncbi:MAG: hypothetical protein KKE62_16425 [Proteobacteria bacterium]|nr:hypothetical protein [Pseudomonadota bacterium]MBU1389552.1 hypothetical protein [Pseudomonadota bacterium]MBU1544416.1 hypothetical protein [Pseudomonadota bacterium]MBU2430519.1 hypothetical protein [Pseudomonadota bacterium]MBU2480690.1 hypothetical protein [Pseudomonadota bacterium]
MIRPFFRLLQKENGSILIAVVVTMVIISVLGAGLVSITGTADYHQTGSNSSSNAFYLAEAGFHYARSQIANISDLHEKTYTLINGNSFSLELKTWDFDIMGVSGTQLQTQVPYGTVPFSTIAVSGRIAVGNTVFTYSSIDVSANAVNFNISGGTPLPTTGKVKLAALKNGTSTISENSTISVKDTNPLYVFPDHNGTFTIGTQQYRYGYKTANSLVGITSVNGPWPGDFALNDDDPVILDSFIQLNSTGTFGTGLMASQRILTYHIPLPGGSSEEPTDYFDDKDSWSPNTGPGSTGEGEFDVTTDEDGNSVLIVTDNTNVTGYLDTSSIDYDWQNNGPDLEDLWITAGNYLSYNAQIKIKVNDPIPSTYPADYRNMPDNYFYMAGISFRKQSNGDSYGLSFYRAEPDNRDGIPDTINPHGGGTGNGGQAMVLLWERIGPDFENWRWLAYANLSDVNLMRERTSIFEDDFEAGLGNWTPGVPDGFGLETVTGHDGTPSQIITDSPGSNYSGNRNYQITSNTIDVTGQTSLTLSFWHRYVTQYYWDRCYVEVRPDAGTWQTLGTYSDTQNSWEFMEFDLRSYLPAASIQIRFSLQTNRNVNRDGWRIDDVKLSTLTPKWMTLLLHLDESDLSGTKTNEIKAYISDEFVRGTANTIAQDNNRLNNIVGETHWPPDNVNDTNSTNDHFTLIRWDGINTNVTLAGTGNELESIIRVNTLTSPNSGTFAEPEIGLHAWGWNYNVMYFDDFSMQTD